MQMHYIFTPGQSRSLQNSLNGPKMFFKFIHKKPTKTGVSKTRGTPKWMVYNGNPIKMDDLGVALFLETPKHA